MQTTPIGERATYSHSQYPEFTSPKITGKVIYRRRWQLIALIQLSLDPEVEQIRPTNMAQQRHGCPTIDILSDGSWAAISFCDRPNISCATCGGKKPHRQINRDDAMVEQRRRNCIDIYNAARIDVPIEFRLRLLEFLRDRNGQAEMSELISIGGGRDFNAATGILAMAWLGLIKIPIDVAWTPVTKIEIAQGTKLYIQTGL